MILDEVKKKAIPILKRARVKRAALFGSAARGEMKPGDVDLLVEMSRPYGLFTFLALKADLEDALGKEVDLIEYSVLKPIIRERVLHDAVEIL